MTSLEDDLKKRLSEIRQNGLYRELRKVASPQGRLLEVDGRQLLNFSSNDYLGLANHPALKEAAILAVEKFGTGSGASRLISGSLLPHHELEEALATFKQCEAALSFSSGYAAAVGTICALLGKDDVIVLDKLVHASIVDAARLSGAKLRVFAHNDLADLEDILCWAKDRRTSVADTVSRVLIVTESVFSMDGDLAPLRELVALKETYGAWLMVDEAHATGLYGPARRGLADALSVSSQIDIQMGTLGKALGAAGGYICGSRTLIDFLINRARSFVFSTAPVPAAAAAARAALQLVQSPEGAARNEMLWRNVEQFTKSFPQRPTKSAIIPIVIGDESEAVAKSSALNAQGIFVPAIRYPTVARGEARLRVTITASHTPADIESLLLALNVPTRAVA